MKQHYIKVRDQMEGFHSYPDAPDEVAFLKARHRHLFKIEATIEVFEKDRELEFFMTKENLKRAIANLWLGSDNPGSCETMADRILDDLMKVYGERRYYHVEVSEDGESSGTVEYDPWLQ